MNTVTVKINGMEYNLKGKENQEYLIQLAGYVDGKLREIMNKNSKLSSTAVAVLTCLNIGDELSKCDKEAADLIEKVRTLEEKDLKAINLIEEIKREAKEFSDVKDQEIDSLRKIIETMEEKIADVNDLNEKVKLLTNNLKEVDILKSELESVNMQSDVYKENLSIKEIECEDYKESNDKLNKEIVEIKEYMAEEISNEMKNNEVLNSKIKELSVQAVGYREELKIKEIECGKYKENNVELNKEIKEVKEVTTKEYEKIKREIKLLNSGNDDLRSAVEDSYSKISILEEKNSRLLKENNKLCEEVKLKEKQIAESVSRDESNKYKEELKSLEEQITIMEKELKSNIKMKEKIKARSKEMHFQLQNSKFRVLDLEKKIVDVQIELAKSKKVKSPFLK
ncbi:MAG: cell division protein ZapA [Clostridium sp.]